MSQGCPYRWTRICPFGEEHQPRTTCSTTPAPRSSRISQREPGELSAPRSMNSAAGLGATDTLAIGSACAALARSRERQP